MKNEITDLQNKFNVIKNKGYIKGLKQNSIGNAGLTFENLIGKKNDEFQIADYNGIEIKTRNSFNTMQMTLFSLVPSNAFGLELKRLRDTYGYPDSDFKNINRLTASIYGNKKSYLKNFYSFKLLVDYLEKKVFLCIYNPKNILIEKKIYWDFEDIITMINNKLLYLAIVKYRSIIKNSEKYFKYNSINFYKFKNISTFFDLVNNGVIKLSICLGVYKSGYKKGKEHDHGVTFSIREEDILKLYDKFII